MLIYLKLEPANMYDSVHELIRMVYPDAEIKLEPGHEDITVEIAMHIEKQAVIFDGKITDNKDTLLKEEFPLLAVDTRLQINIAARTFVFKLLSCHLARPVNAYGILTGVRPVKLVQRFIDQGYSAVKIIDILKSDYLVSQDKAVLLTETAFNNRPFLPGKEAARKLISVYIGIPYCPSRCYYCSFPGAVLRDYQTEIPVFLQALYHEIESIGEHIKTAGFQVETIYIGGGTPTVLSVSDLEELFNNIDRHLSGPETAEITVEAGRPDTLSLDKLSLLKARGVTRVCINPQTMNNHTLQIIGRNHDEKEVMQSVEWARQAGIEKLNMDIIVGLPGESLRENTYTANRILEILPENITVHTLAVKRGSLMAEYEQKSSMADRVKEVENGVKLFSEVLRAKFYEPYYLYRQKYMKGNMENTGYATPGSYCRYNINMIEERQTIIGIGGGAASKFINPDNWTLSSFYNPKDPSAYGESLQTLIVRKVDKLMALN